MTSRTRIGDWSKLVLRETDSFSNALEVMDRGGYQLALVLDNDGKLLGMVTDSDVRKALLRGIEINNQVAEVMNTSPLVVSAELGDQQANQLMLINHFFHLPVVDNDGKLIALHVAEQFRSLVQRSEALVIMAGGRGKRLMPLTENTPKPMLPLQGRPILEHIIERAKLEGFKRIAISVNYLASVITDYFGDGSRHGVCIEYLHEDQPLGTAGALAYLPEDLKDNYVIVTNADVITDVAYGDILNQTIRDSSDGTMAVRMQEWQNPFGVVHSIGKRLTRLEEKPVTRHQVNAGIYAIGPRLLNLLEAGDYCDMPELFLKGIKKNLDLNIFPLHESWLDIGRHEDYGIANK